MSGASVVIFCAHAQYLVIKTNYFCGFSPHQNEPIFYQRSNFYSKFESFYFCQQEPTETLSQWSPVFENKYKLLDNELHSWFLRQNTAYKTYGFSSMEFIHIKKASYYTKVTMAIVLSEEASRMTLAKDLLVHSSIVLTCHFFLWDFFKGKSLQRLIKNDTIKYDNNSDRKVNFNWSIQVSCRKFWAGTSFCSLLK